ncbi:MAG: hypothetical protein J6S41_04580 [Clostridia bacterium]|jgi:hypothetical protein|nr:hypothetical protein [Clostridia bacterium]
MTFSIYEISQWQVTFRNVTREQAVKIMQSLTMKKIWQWGKYERGERYFFGGIVMTCTDLDSRFHTVDFSAGI